MGRKKNSKNVKHFESDVEGSVDMNVTSTSNYEANLASVSEEEEVMENGKVKTGVKKATNLEAPYFLRSRGKAPLAEGLSGRIKYRKKKSKNNRKKETKNKKNKKAKESPEKVVVKKSITDTLTDKNLISTVYLKLDKDISSLVKNSINQYTFEEGNSYKGTRGTFSRKSSTKENITEKAIQKVSPSILTNSENASRSVTKLVTSKTTRKSQISRKSYSNISSCTQTKLSYDGLVNKNIFNKGNSLSKDLFKKNITKKRGYSAAFNFPRSEETTDKINNELEKTHGIRDKAYGVYDKTHEEYKYSFGSLVRPPLHSDLSETLNDNNDQTSSGFNNIFNHTYDDNIIDLASKTVNIINESNINKDIEAEEDKLYIDNTNTTSPIEKRTTNKSSIIITESYSPSDVSKEQTSTFEESTFKQTSFKGNQDDHQSDMNTSWWGRLGW